MTTSKPVPEAPSIPGHTPLAHVGSGGYADVYLYEQAMPHRRVAVKVLKPEALAGGIQRTQFASEANTMARVSTHPFIVSIFHADIAADGRPYLVMEYYPGDNYLARARREQFSVAEVLRVGVQIGSALETAHRAGILHRDIKPANILTSEFRRPGLTDFGIAATVGPGGNEAEGISIPWSPPEAFGDGDMGVAADVYSLAATLYHLLCGRSPYEVPGGDNSALALIARIERGNLPSIGRADVPTSLERVLAQAMSPRVGQRPARVVDFLRQLQGIESEQRLSVTPLELAEDTTPVRERRADDDDATRIKGVSQIDAQASPVAIESVPTDVSRLGALDAPAPRTREGMLAEPDVGDTVHIPPMRSPSDNEGAQQVGPRRRLVIGAIVGLAAIAGTLLAVGVIGGNDAADGRTSATAFGEGEGEGDVVTVEPPAAVENLSAEVLDGSVVFTWDAPGETSDDFYELVATLDDAASETANTANRSYTVEVAAGTKACLSVIAHRPFTSPSVATKKCVDV